MMKFIVFCGEGKKEASRHGETAARARDEADDEDAAEREFSGGGGGEGDEIEGLEDLIEGKDDKEGSADFHPFALVGCYGSDRRRIIFNERVSGTADHRGNFVRIGETARLGGCVRECR